MTTHHIRLAFDLIGDLFPDGTSKEVASYLNRKGPLPFALLVRDLNIPAVNVARSLAVLAMHDIVECTTAAQSGPKRVLYALNLKRTLYILHYSKCIHCARQLYSFEGELIIEELLLNGKQRMSTLLVKVYERLIKAGKDPQTHSLRSIEEKFKALVSAQFLQRLLVVDCKPNTSVTVEETAPSTATAPELTADAWKYLLSRQQEETDEPSAKKIKPTVPVFGDEKIFWKVNFQRFFAYLRDEELIQAFTNRIDQVTHNRMLVIFTLPRVFRTLEKSFERFSDWQQCGPTLSEQCPSRSSM